METDQEAYQQQIDQRRFTQEDLKDGRSNSRRLTCVAVTVVISGMRCGRRCVTLRSGDMVQILSFASFLIKLKSRVPNLPTSLEVIKIRFSIPGVGVAGCQYQDVWPCSQCKSIWAGQSVDRNLRKNKGCC